MEVAKEIVHRRHQERADRVFAQIELATSPGREGVGRVTIFIEARTIELAERVIIGRKMDRGEIEDDADARFVATVDERHELLRIAIAAIDAIETCGLITPGAIERILGNRHDFDMGIA